MKNKKWRNLYSLSGTFVCPYCLQEFPLSKATIDHKNPYARFRDDSSENKILCCKEDNNKKGMLTSDEYMLYLLLDRVRKGNKNGRDLETLDRHRQELSCIVNGSNQNIR